ncbi:MAG: hypothetical protein H6822_25560 [Planctomycetaceae bacterium]|nr:hypothetical protein [Planctomycetaceae bacterium]
MSTNGFWADGPDEHRWACEKYMAELRSRLENCEPDEREQIAKELEQASDELKKCSDGRILW